MRIITKYYFWIYFLIIGISVNCDKGKVIISDSLCYQCNRIDSLISTSKSKEISQSVIKANLINAYELLDSIEIDSSKIKYLFRISNRLYSLKDYHYFRKVGSEFLRLSIKTRDSMSIADYYWNMGIYFSSQEVLDSAYYNFGEARYIYKKLDHKYYQAKMEYNIAYVLRRSKNYIESEAFALRSISNLSMSNRKMLLYRCYNHLGLLYNDLNEFEFSIMYHLKAMELIDDLPKKGIYLERSLNNLSLVYQKQKQYELAIEAIDKALANPILKLDHPNLYAKLLDNRAYCRFLKGEESEVFEDFNAALAIRDSIDNRVGIGISKMHLGEYHLKNQDSSLAYTEVKEANEIAQELGLNRDILNSLFLLSKTDPAHASFYMNSYIKLNDSLLSEERKIRDKFTRIQFETEGYIAANEDLKKKNSWISMSSLLALASISLLFFAYRQKSKNRTLLLEKQQQKFNEEIYDLMLKQQNREEEGRMLERIRISQDLHDGILARLFSVRIGMGFLKVKGSENEEDRFRVFMKELQDVEKDIRNLSHALKNEDLSSKKDFPKLLLELLDEQRQIGGFSFELKRDKTIAWNLVDEKIKLNLYRMIQEAIYNIMKYAACEKIELRLERNQKSVDIFIVDDGSGFDTNKRYKGIGLKNMKSRSRSIGAKLSIRSEINKGTVIKVSIPTKTLYHEPTTKSADH